MKQVRRWHYYSDSESLKKGVINEILDCAQQSILARGCFLVVLAGGNTPRAVYQGLRNIKTDWSAWHIYFGDERCLPIGAVERNDSMAQHCWLSQVAIPSEQVYCIPAELGATEGAKAYAETLKSITSFDLVLLGLGEDGHTASLFPGHNAGEDAEAPDVLAVHNAPKPPPERISLSANRLGRAKRVMFLVSGEGKRGAINKWQDERMIPAASVCPKQGVDIYTDLVFEE